MNEDVDQAERAAESARSPADCRSLRVLHLVNHLRNTGNGIVNSVVDLAIEQARLGHEVTVASAGGGYEALLLQHGVAVVRLDQRKLSHCAAVLWRLRAWCRKHDPDIVHAHMMAGAVLARAALLWHSALLVTTVHNSWQWHSFLMRLGDRIIATTEGEAELLRERVRRPAKVHAVPYGVIASVRRQVEEPIDDVRLARPSLVTIAGLYERKGIFELLAAYGEVVKRGVGGALYFVGDGPERERLQGEIDRCGLTGRVFCLGFRPDTRFLLGQTDVFVLASRAEPFGLVLAEAREAGCAVVATEVGGMPSVLDGGSAGRLVPANDRPALEHSLFELLTDTPARERLARSARTGLERFSIERMAVDTVHVYRSRGSKDAA